MTFWQAWVCASLGFLSLMGTLAFLWLAKGPQEKSQGSQPTAKLQPMIYGMKRACWDCPGEGNWPSQPNLLVQAQRAEVECPAAGEFYEIWHQWQLSWRQPERAGILAATGEVGLFEPIHRHFRGSQVAMKRLPTALLSKSPSSQGKDLRSCELEVECAELVLDFSASTPGNAH